jgi:hypothetical protein
MFADSRKERECADTTILKESRSQRSFTGRDLEQCAMVEHAETRWASPVTLAPRTFARFTQTSSSRRMPIRLRSASRSGRIIVCDCSLALQPCLARNSPQCRQQAAQACARSADVRSGDARVVSTSERSQKRRRAIICSGDRALALFAYLCRRRETPASSAAAAARSCSS